MGHTEFRDEEPPQPAASLRELRRSYHDRIAEVRDRSVEVLRCAIEATSAATAALSRAGLPPVQACDGGRMQALAAQVDSEVVGLLALESPMARDLRVILATRDVTQIGLLCVGLCLTLSERVRRAAAALGPELCRLAMEVGAGTEGLMRQAEAAWVTLDPDLAGTVADKATEVRRLQREFITALIALGGQPMDSALDLAMVARAFERLADHAVEIAERVLFAVHGTPAPLPGT